MRISRRQIVAAGLGSLAAGAASTSAVASDSAVGSSSGGNPFKYCFNTATILRQNVPLDREAEITAAAGYVAIEPWISRIREFKERGGSLSDVKKKIADLGLTVESAIGFADWLSDDDAKRTRGLEEMKRDMELVAAIGGKRIAAPPGGAYNAPMPLDRVAARYRKLLELGRNVGIVPQLELWGGAKTLHTLGEVAYVIVEAAHPDACALLDTFHIYRGGSDFAGLAKFSGAAMHVYHVNDYPATPPRAQARDSDRVFTGDGVAPTTAIFRMLRDIGYRGMLSVELFNPEYYKQDPAQVAKLGFARLKAAVEKALA